MSQPELIWVRVRTKSSAALGEWFWRQFWVPAKFNTPAKQRWYLETSGEISELADELNTQSEHWRGIDWEVRRPPAHIIEAEQDRIQAQINGFQEKATVLRKQLAEAPAVDVKALAKKECRQWPRCGCMQQFKSKDCRRPYYTSCVILFEDKWYRVIKSPVPKVEAGTPDNPSSWKVIKVSKDKMAKMVVAADERLAQIRKEVQEGRK